MKGLHRVFSRFEKPEVLFLGFVSIAHILDALLWSEHPPFVDGTVCITASTVSQIL